eukprot:jgi/Galph1/2902/GphlegSOOS_G1549.1
MESALLDSLFNLLPKSGFSVVVVDEIGLGELSELNFDSSERFWSSSRWNPETCLMSLLPVKYGEGESASESSSLSRKTQGDYASGSTQNKPFRTVISNAGEVNHADEQFWEYFKQLLTRIVEDKTFLGDFGNVEQNIEKLLQYCGVSYSNVEKDLFGASHELIMRTEDNTSYLSQFDQGYSIPVYSSSRHHRRIGFQQCLRQSPFDWKKFFSANMKELKTFGITQKHLEPLLETSQFANSSPTEVAITEQERKASDDSFLFSEDDLEDTTKLDDIEAVHREVDRLLTNDRFVDIVIDKAERKQNISKAPNEHSYAIFDNQNVSDFQERVPFPARIYPFELDDFQKRSILHLERGENVFVSAHTSAGKTVVAEYAIALSIQHQTKAIYTSPIKSLSNQKYREFLNIFEDVGIVTGDVSIRPEASCLIMTTEILRSMLYKGADLTRDIEFVIFDEVHYINDEERGVVWEEVIIMLPASIKLVMLSATVPNAIDFAKWVGKTRKSEVFVVATSQRPVPLQHSIFFENRSYMMVTPDGKFMMNAYRRLMEKVKSSKVSSANGVLHNGTQDWLYFVKYLNEKNLVPVVIFCFAKKRCDELAATLNSIDLTTDSSEKSYIHSFIDSCIARLRKEDRDIPQIGKLRDLLKRGIGIHHAGILPLMKEAIEILFQKGLVRILFATETFAMGVNMPAKTVVFSSIRKHDGKKFRFIQPGEYIQMAGRAGRRGIDSVGTVLLFLKDELPELYVLRKIMTGEPIKLLSQFRLNYNMILNLLRFEDIRVEDLIRNSFCEAPYARDVRAMSQMLIKGESKLEQLDRRISFLNDRLHGVSSDDFCSFHDIYSKFKHLTEYLSKKMYTDLQRRQQYLDMGRIVQILDGYRIHFAILLELTKVADKPNYGGKVDDRFQRKELSENLNCVVVVRIVPPALRKTENASRKHHNRQLYSGKIGSYEWRIERIPLNHVVAAISEKIHQLNIDVFRFPNEVTMRSEFARCVDRLRCLYERPGAIPFVRIPPREDMQPDYLEVLDCWNRREMLFDSMEQQNGVLKSPKLESSMKLLELKENLREKLATIRWALSDESLQLMPDYNLKIKVLQKLGFINEENVVQLKGRAACELNTCDSVLATEIIFENILESLNASECASFFSSFIFEGSSVVLSSNLPKVLLEALEKQRTVAFAIGKLQEDCGLPITAKEYVSQNIHAGLTEVVHCWAEGVIFSDICTVTDVPEGTIVRVINRLSELLKEVKSFCRVVGNSDLHRKLQEADERIRRDICFAASLYVS